MEIEYSKKYTSKPGKCLSSVLKSGFRTLEVAKTWCSRVDECEGVYHYKNSNISAVKKCCNDPDLSCICKNNVEICKAGGVTHIKNN
tara:strand:+ start:1141 stop:1401 length:261 start_codon:yes stop_codon:yes gene_type:complete